jgi:hypothetical protein
MLVRLYSYIIVVWLLMLTCIINSSISLFASSNCYFKPCGSHSILKCCKSILFLLCIYLNFC